MQRGPPADGAHHLHAGPFAPGAIDVDDLVALLPRQVDGLAGELVQRAHGRDGGFAHVQAPLHQRSEEHTSELQSLMRISYAVCSLNKNNYCTLYSIIVKIT